VSSDLSIRRAARERGAATKGAGKDMSDEAIEYVAGAVVCVAFFGLIAFIAWLGMRSDE